MSKTFRGADALVETLKAAGVTRIFTLSGNHIMPIFDATVGSGIGLIHTRHEAAAVHMADAWSRLTGEVGIALVTGGPGHANAVSALYTAQMAEAPVVLLSGHAPTTQLGMGAFQEMRQADMAAPVTKAAWVCSSSEKVASAGATAMRLARSGRPGPVHLSLPTDVLEGAAPTDGLPEAAAFATITVPLAAADAECIRDLLAAAMRPLILAGPACMTRRGRAALAALEAACGIPVVGMESPRGIADPSLGAFAEVLAEADCVLLLGKRLDFTLKFGGSPAFASGCTFLQIDAEAGEPARTRRAVGERLVATAEADAFSALAALSREASWPHGKHLAWLTKARAAIAYRPPAWNDATASAPGSLHPVQMLRPLQAMLDRHPDAVLISDGGEIGQWAQACLTAPHRLINGVAGSIGSSLPYALAARCAVPDAPVIAVMGDGTFGFHAAEIDTAVRHGLAFVAVVGNDARWNAEYQIQLKDYGVARLTGCELLATRYDLVAAAFGGHGEFVTDPDELSAAAQRALVSGLPACVNTMIEGLAAPQIKRPAGHD